MGDEIDKYLVAKLDAAIQEVLEPAEQPLLAKCFNLPSKLADLQKSLNDQSTPKFSRETLYKLNNLLTELQMKSKKQSHGLDSWRVSSKIKELKDRDKEKDNGAPAPAPVPPPDSKIQARSVDNGAPAPVPPPDSNIQAGSVGADREPRKAKAYRWSGKPVDENKVYGVQDKVMSLQRLLVPGEKELPKIKFKAIGIVGMRGIGKTTLCRVIFQKPEVKSHFLPRIWVRTTGHNHPRRDDDDSKKDIVKRMLEALGVEEEIINYAEEKHQLKGLLFALRLQLEGKRYLIVLDDVRADDKHEDFYSFLDQEDKHGERLAYGLPKGFGGTVIVTGRDDEFVENMVGEDNLHRLLPLSDRESCWKIFKDSAEKDGGKISPDLEKMQDKIVDKCAGLPLAAKMMGKIDRLKNKPNQQAVPERGQDETRQEEVRPQAD